MNILQIRSNLVINGVSTQVLTISKELEKKGNKVIIASASGDYMKEVEKSNIKHYLINELDVNKRNVVCVIKSIIKIRRIIKCENIDVIHAHNAATAGVAFIAGIGKKPVIQTIHGLELREKYKWRNKIYKLLPIHFISIADFIREQLIDLGVKESNIHSVFNGVNPERFDVEATELGVFRQEYNIDDDTIILVNVAELNRNKNQLGLIEALPFIIRNNNEKKIKCVFVGKDKENNRELCINKAKELGVEEHSIFTGIRYDVPEILNDSDIFVFPSKRGEVLPCAIIEAMFMKKPWVGTDLAGIPQLSDNGNNGTIVTKDSPIELANAINMMLENKAKMVQMGINGYKYASDNLTIDVVANKLVNVYTKILK